MWEYVYIYGSDDGSNWTQVANHTYGYGRPEKNELIDIWHKFSFNANKKSFLYWRVIVKGFAIGYYSSGWHTVGTKDPNQKQQGENYFTVGIGAKDIYLYSKLCALGDYAQEVNVNTENL